MIHLVTDVSRFFGRFRWLFMPAGLFALVAIGVHAGCSRLSDPLVLILDSLDSLVDRSATVTLTWLAALLDLEPATAEATVRRVVDAVDLDDRTMLARWLCVALELVADLAAALPMLGYREIEKPANATGRARSPGPRGLTAVLHQAVRRPTPLLIGLPLVTGALVVAGIWTTASLAQTESLSVLEHFATDSLALQISGLFGFLLFGALCICLGIRALGQALWWAHQRSAVALGSRRRPLLLGALRIAIASPVAFAALQGLPLLSLPG